MPLFPLYPMSPSKAAARSRLQGACAASAQQVTGRPVARCVLLEFRHSLPALLSCIGTACVEPAA